MGSLFTVWSGPYAILARIAAYGLLVAAIFGYGWLKGAGHEKVATEAVQAQFTAFKTQVATEGAAAQQRAIAQALSDKKRKESADAQLTKARSDLATANAGWLREREERTRSGFLPAGAPTSSNPARATLDRAKFERTMEYLDEQGAGIAARGDDQRIGLDVVKG